MKTRYVFMLALATVSALALALVGCGSSEEPGLITIDGVYCGDLGADENYQSLFIVFDYANDDTNRTMPEDPAGVTVQVNDDNVYTVDANPVQEYTSSRLGTYEVSPYGYVERYTGYRYVVGYGDLPGGSEPVRMLAGCLFNPNDLKTGDTITLTVGEEVATFPVSDVMNITYGDEIMKCEPDFETAQILAAEKWRIDMAAEVARSLPDDLRFGGGEQFSGYSQSMKNLFSSDSGGLTIFEEPQLGFDSKTHTFNKVVDGLPAYDHDVIAKGYPDVIELIDSYEAQFEKLSESILDASVDKEAYAEQIAEILDTYHKICDTLGMEPIKNL